jgi:hypothetical protein
MSFTIVPIAEEHIESFRAAVDRVAREHRYLALLEAPPLEAVRKFVQGNIQNGNPQYVALVEGTVVGWCDVIPGEPEAVAHVQHGEVEVAEAQHRAAAVPRSGASLGKRCHRSP